MRLTWATFATTLALLSSATAFAGAPPEQPKEQQQQPPSDAKQEPPSNPAEQAPPKEEPPPGVVEKSGDIESAIAADAAKLPKEEKKRRAEQMLVDMREALTRANEILVDARAGKDIVQLNCVNAKLTQIKGLLKISEQASVRMYDAMASTQDDLVNHEFTKMAVAHQKVMVLRAQADQCVGESTIYAGDTEVQVEVDPNISGGDPTESEPPPAEPATPPVASGL